MPRSGLLVAILICCGPALATPSLRVSLHDGVDATPRFDIGPGLHLAPQPLGVPVTWESLRDPAPDAPAGDICAEIDRAGRTDGQPLPFDRAQVISKLLDTGLCSGDAG